MLEMNRESLPLLYVDLDDLETEEISQREGKICRGPGGPSSSRLKELTNKTRVK